MEIHPQDTEVVAKPRRRTFTAQYKRKIVRQADACKEPGDVGALLRREGLYSSHLTRPWSSSRPNVGVGRILIDGGC